MKIFAKYKSAKSSAQKLRLIIKTIKNEKYVKNILDILNFLNKKSAFLIKKTLESAISNAEHNYNLNINDLKLKKIFIDQGPSSKRIFPRAKGRVNYITKRTSNITVIISN